MKKLLLLPILLALFLLWQQSVSIAQTVLTIDIKKGVWQWGWTPAPSGETATSFRVYCGTNAGGPYPLVKDTGNVTVFTLPISSLITSPGTYFCRVKSYASSTGLESDPSNEVTFLAAFSPTAPSSFVIQ
jgi:hypothetical protein